MALRRAQRGTRVLVVSLVMTSLLTITLDYREGQSGPFEAMGRVLFSVVGPMQEAVAKIFHPVGSFFSGIAHVGSLESENRRLTNQIRTLKAQNSQATNLERQLTELQQLIDIKQRLNLASSAGANVIGSSIGNFEWSVNIDVGSHDGIGVGMPVLAANGLVGHVIEVTGCCSKVQLIIDPQSAVAARLSSTGGTGLIVGQRNQDLQMQLVAPDADVPAGEDVVTSGYQGGLYPPGIPIGIVSHVYSQQGGLSKIIQVRPAVDFSALEFVLVITNRTTP